MRDILSDFSEYLCNNGIRNWNYKYIQQLTFIRLYSTTICINQFHVLEVKYGRSHENLSRLSVPNLLAQNPSRVFDHT